MEHALGLDRSATPYRNYYVVPGRDAVWEGLCAAGAARRHSFNLDESWVYHVTDEGKAAL